MNRRKSLWKRLCISDRCMTPQRSLGRVQVWRVGRQEVSFKAVFWASQPRLLHLHMVISGLVKEYVDSTGLRLGALDALEQSHCRLGVYTLDSPSTIYHFRVYSCVTVSDPNKPISFRNHCNVNRSSRSLLFLGDAAFQ